MKEKKVKKNMNRSKLFSVVINPKFEETIDWKLMSDVEIRNKLKELKFPDRFLMTEILNQVQFENVNKNKTDAQDFEGQLEIGMETCIPHYQLALEVSSICTKKSFRRIRATGRRSHKCKYSI